MSPVKEVKIKEWVEIEWLDENNKPTGEKRIVRDFMWKNFLNAKIKHFQYIRHCHTELG